jgi:hypothetical protein
MSIREEAEEWARAFWRSALGKIVGTIIFGGLGVLWLVDSYSDKKEQTTTQPTTEISAAPTEKTTISSQVEEVVEDVVEDVPIEYEDFTSFISAFTSDEDYQLAHINFPLSSCPSKDQWTFLGTNDIFDGSKQIKGTEYQGIFSQISDSKYTYQFGLYESDTLFGITFTKSNGKWMLTEISSPSEEGYD